MSENDFEAEERRARRRWIRDHHPDLGGDPAFFAEHFPLLGSQSAESPKPSVRRTRPVRRTLRKLRKAVAAARRSFGRRGSSRLQ